MNNDYFLGCKGANFLYEEIKDNIKSQILKQKPADKIALNSYLGVIRFAEIKDVPYVVDLSKKESFSLGFIPKMAYTSAITGIKTGKRWSPVCNDKMWVCECNGDLVGFVLASFGRINAKERIGKVAQICLQTDARKLERGKMLLNAVLEYGKSINVSAFSCGCAHDLDSNMFWSAMGWEKIGERMGISCKNTWKQTSDRVVNIYKSQPLIIVPETTIIV